jgi:hypothetical protein
MEQDDTLNSIYVGRRSSIFLLVLQTGALE